MNYDYQFGHDESGEEEIEDEYVEYSKHDEEPQNPGDGPEVEEQIDLSSQTYE